MLKLHKKGTKSNKSCRASPNILSLSASPDWVLLVAFGKIREASDKYRDDSPPLPSWKYVACSSKNWESLVLWQASCKQSTSSICVKVICPSVLLSLILSLSLSLMSITYNIGSTVPAPERCALVDRCAILAAVTLALLPCRCGYGLRTTTTPSWRPYCVLSRLPEGVAPRLPQCLATVRAGLSTLMIACPLIRGNCATCCICNGAIGSGRGSTPSGLEADDAHATACSLAMACLPASFLHLV